jgi:hypothetical protein
MKILKNLIKTFLKMSKTLQIPSIKNQENLLQTSLD